MYSIPSTALFLTQLHCHFVANPHLPPPPPLSFPSSDGRHRFFDDHRFQYTAQQRRKAALFYLGPKGSGVSFHEHTNAWNGLVYGRKVPA